MTSDTYRYAGTELAVFADAQHWKRYLATQIGPFVRGRVLEVGAGIGRTTSALWQPSVTGWTSLEPDAGLAASARRYYSDMSLDASVRIATTGSLAADERFDAILYIDVLEHIADDLTELRSAAEHLEHGGHLVVLSPAHQWLFSAFDEAVGHRRRYTAATLRRAVPDGLIPVRLRYLDAAGIAASLANALVLRRQSPRASQVRFWDRVMVPVSRAVDPLLGFMVGKSLLGVWQQTDRRRRHCGMTLTMQPGDGVPDNGQPQGAAGAAGP